MCNLCAILSPFLCLFKSSCNLLSFVLSSSCQSWMSLQRSNHLPSFFFKQLVVCPCYAIVIWPLSLFNSCPCCTVVIYPFSKQLSFVPCPCNTVVALLLSSLTCCRLSFVNFVIWPLFLPLLFHCLHCLHYLQTIAFSQLHS